MRTTLGNGLRSALNNYQQNRRVTPFDITILLRQLALLISAGIPIIKSLEILEATQQKKSLRHTLFLIKQDVRAGKNIFNSFLRHRTYFDQLTCHLIQIGEQSGKLDLMLNIIANYQEKNLILRQRIKQALFYPCFILIVALFIMLGMLLFVIPHFAELFQDAQITLPLLTRCLFQLSALLKHALFWLIIPFCLCMLLLVLRNNASALKQKCLRLPIIKQFVHKIVLTRFMRNLAVTFNAGIPLIEGLKLAANAAGNTEFICVITRLRDKISSGLQLHQAMESLPAFPVLLIQMTKIGEESGMLAQVLNKTADFFAAEIDQQLTRASQLLEPLIILVLGVVIGGMMAGMYLPIFKLGSAL